MEDLNNTINQPDQIDIFRTFYPTAKNTFFSNACGTFTTKQNLNKFKSIPVIQSIFPDCNYLRNQNQKIGGNYQNI